MNSGTAATAASQILSNKQRCLSILQAPAPAPAGLRISMRDRSNNRRALQKGRNLSSEAIQAVQALKRAATGSAALEAAMESRFRRLLKLDMMAVLRELLRQDRSHLALKVFEEIQREWWYKPKVRVYAEVVSHLGRQGLSEEIRAVFRGLKQRRDGLESDDIEGFNALLRSLLESNLNALAVECMYLMKSVGCDLNKSSFHILADGFDSNGDPALAALLRLHAHHLYASF